MAAAPEDLATAVEHFRSGREAEALAITGRHEIVNALGTELAKRGDLEGAERCYREAIALAPGFFKPHNNLGNVLLGRGDLEAAVEHYRAALRIEPSAHRVHGNLGNTLFGLGLWTDAVDAYRSALAQGAGAAGWLRLGEALEALGDTEEALVAYRKAAELGEAKGDAKCEELVRALSLDGPFGRPAVPAPRDARGRRPLVEAAGDELRALLAPLSPSTFVDEVWGKRPLFVKGFADKYRGFFDGAAFVEAVAAPGRPLGSVRASFDKRGGAPERVTQAFAVTPDQVRPLSHAGATICITEAELGMPRLAAFIAAIKRQLGYPGQVVFNAYASPPGAGFNWHFDGRVATTLQIEGTKRWRFSRRPAIDWPRGNGTRLADGAVSYTDKAIARGDWERLGPLDETEITTVILEPGDLLVLPAGVWHDACGGPVGSLALNLAFLPVSHTKIVDELLDVLLESDPAWRSAAPSLPAGLDALQRQVEKASEALRRVATDRAALLQVWASFVEGR